MGEENMNPAGLGSKLYFCRKEDFEKDPNTPMQEVKLEPVKIDDIAMFEDVAQECGNGYSGMKGFTLTGTATFNGCTKEQKKLMRRMMYGQGRLPRRRKKKLMNRVLSREKICRVIARFTVRPMFDKNDALDLTVQVMFNDKAHGLGIIIINEAEYHTAYLCLKRIKKKYRKYINQQELWKKE